MNIDEIKKISLVEFLNQLGYHTRRLTEFAALFIP